MLFNRLKSWLVVGLLVSNLAVGLLSLFYLNSINERYASLIDTNVPLINRLRTLTRELGNVQRYARRVVGPVDDREWASLVEEMDAASNTVRAHAAELSRVELFKDTRHAQTLVKFGRDYDDRADQFLVLVRQRKFDEANQFNAGVMRPLYDRYQLELDAAADFVQRQGTDLQARYAEESRWFSRLLLAFAGWPVVAVVLAIVPVVLFFLLLLLAILAPGFGGRRPVEPPAA
jgi:hypothetical protein